MSDLKNVQPLSDFNWDEFENGSKANVSKEELEKAYDETLNKVSEHQVVDGKVISIDKKEVVVNIGYKSDGVIPASEFRYNPDLKIGDVVEVYVENQEDKKGQLLLSHKKARLSKSWERVNAALDNEEVIQGYIKCRTKGGMIVDVFGIEAFSIIPPLVRHLIKPLMISSFSRAAFTRSQERVARAFLCDRINCPFLSS